MGKHDELLKTIEARLVSAGVAATTGGARETIRVEVGSADAEMARLQALRAGTESGLDIERPLGEGGMGLVLLATQRSLDRKVAVKTVREKSIDAIVRLVREAKITGGLEHPNVVPVHDLSVGPDGIPRLVLKRVEGTTWTERMRDEAGVRDQFGAKDLLEWNVQTLMQVCQAVHFANSRGIVHRDLKPDNVMIGTFGEVYVVDWGIAIRPSDKRDVDLADTVGTPVYMAPEMLVGETVDARTDVYLLGGILFEILSGRPPHDHAHLRVLIQSVLDTPPALHDGPEELVSLARSCLARDPTARPSSAEAVRRALADFLRHRESAALAARATAKAEALVRTTDSAAAQRLYGECVFGFRAALEAWPASPHAREGLVRLVRRMVESDLDNGAPETAALRLLDLPEPEVDLEKRVQRGLRGAAERAKHVEALQRMEVEIDPTTGQRIRLRVAAGLCLIWVASDLFDQGFVRSTPLESFEFYLGQSALHFLVVMGVIVGYWKYFKHSMLNRQLAGMVALCMVMQIAAYTSGWLAGYHLASVQAALLFVWFTVMGMLAVTMVRAMWPSAFGFLVAFFVAAMFPETRHVAAVVANAALLANVIFAWRARAVPRETQRDTWS